MSLLRLGQLLRERRGDRHLRDLAQEVGVSTATLSRIENGHLPDLETFSKLCGFLGLDPADVLNLPVRSASTAAKVPAVAVHFKSDRTYGPELASDLAALILAAQRHLQAEG